MRKSEGPGSEDPSIKLETTIEAAEMAGIGQTSPASFPGQTPIDAYGNGGFRFADMSHRGSLICLPSQMTAWDVKDVSTLTTQDFKLVFEEAGSLQFLLLGTGDTLVVPPAAVLEAFRETGVGIEPMATGAAVRTFNVLLGEGRRVAAALFAVD